MAKALHPEDVLFLQRFLSCCGFYTDTLDGLWGKNTDDADQAFHARSQEIANSQGSFDARSERSILSLQCDAQVAARQSLTSLLHGGRDARIISGTRTYAEQDVLFKQGRFGNPGKIVTKARGGQSWHNFGLAWDIGIFVSGTYITDDKPYEAAGPAGKVQGVEWGGDWVSLKDNPHFQFGSTKAGVAATRAHFESGGRS